MRWMVFAGLLAVGCGGGDDTGGAGLADTGTSSLDGSSPDGSSLDGSSPDASSVDASLPDGSSFDASLPDTASASDAAKSDAVVSDASKPDAAVSDASKSDAAVSDACGYANVDDVVVKCAGKFRMLSYFDVVPSSASCPPYWSFDGVATYGTKEAAIAAAGCDGACVYTFATSVTRLYCGKKTGYEVLKASGCADVYRFAEGYFLSVEAHDAAYPCPA